VSNHPKPWRVAVSDPRSIVDADGEWVLEDVHPDVAKEIVRAVNLCDAIDSITPINKARGQP
jgi:hypothetical protein